MKIVDIATQIYQDAGEPSSSSIPAIAYWIRGKVGDINILLFEDFTVEETSGQYEILDADSIEISIDAVSIIKQLYQIYDYQVQIRAQMNALATDTILEFKEIDGSAFKRTNRNEVSKTLASLRKDELETLKGMVNAYRIKKSGPAQIAGDDTIEGFYSVYNTIGRNTLFG